MTDHASKEGERVETGAHGQLPSSSDPPILETVGLTKRFGGIVALDNVSITFPRGTITAIVGDNGAGKTTLLNILSGAHSSYEGELRLEGVTTHFRGPSDSRRAGVETVYQNLALADVLDVTANFFLGRELTRKVGFGRLFRVVRKKAMRRATRAAVERLDINLPSIYARVGNLSGGQRQGIAIARAANWASRVTLLDEPTAALGVREAAAVERMIKNLNDEGLTIIMVTHRLDQVFRLSHRVAVLRRGRLVGVLDTVKTTSHEVVELITGVSGASSDAWA
jgi:simple sugar transport system ATP-binding protein